MVKIRLMKEEDVPEVLDISALFYKGTTYPFTYSPKDWEVTVRKFLASSIVAVEDGVVVGALVLAIVPVLWNHTEKSATELCFYIREPYRNADIGKRMIEKAEMISQIYGATSVTMASMASQRDAVFNRYYSRIGYKKTEIAYMKEI